MGKDTESNIPTKDIRSWDEFEEFLNDKMYRRWIYRGQADANWYLESSYLRYARELNPIIRPKSKKLSLLNKFEKVMFRKFKDQAHLYFTKLPDKNSTVEWLALMQHHGTPTRMLDWSFSPYIALFFAVESAESKFSVYCFNHVKFKQIDTDYFKQIDEDFELLKKEVFIDRRGDKGFMYAYEPPFKHERIVAQQGLFTISSTNYQSYERIIDEYTTRKDIIMKLNFPPKMIPIAIKKLIHMNINAETLFPGIDGFCRSLKHQIFHDARLTKPIC